MRRNLSALIDGWLLVAAFTTATPAVEAGDTAGAHEVEIFRYEVAPNVVLGNHARDVLPAMMPFGELGVDAYLVVVRLGPGERFVSARAEVRDGIFCIPRSGRGRNLAGRIAARMGYHVALQSAPSEVRKTLGLVTDLVPLTGTSALPPPRLKRRVRLKAGNVEHHEGYVAALLLVAANSVTRLHVDRVVTRSARRSGKTRSGEARTVALPDRSEAALPRGRIMSILSGDEDDRDPWRR